MIGHLFETVPFIKVNGCRLSIHHQADTSDFCGNARDTVYCVKEHELSNPLSLMIFVKKLLNVDTAAEEVRLQAALGA